MSEENLGQFRHRQPQSSLLSRSIEFGVAFISVAIALGVTLGLDAYLLPTPTPLFFAAVMISAWYGGLGPGLLATALSTFAINYLLLEPIHDLHIPNIGTLVQLGVFVMAALLVNSLNESQRAARRRAEANLRSLQSSEARFGCLAKSNIIGTLVAELDGAILDANDNFLQLLGYTQEELRSGRLNWREITPPESLESSERAIQELLTTGSCAPFEKEYIRKDGSRVPVLHGAILTQESTVTGFVLDLSEHKQVQNIQQEAMRRERSLHAEVQAANTHLETVLTSIDDQFFVLDHEWRYIYMSDRVVEVVGKSREALLGKCVWELFPDTVNSEFYKKLHQAVAEQQIIQFEYFYEPWQRWFENRIYPSPAGVSILVIDITDRKQAEEALRHSEARFQVLVSNMPGMVYRYAPDIEGREAFTYVSSGSRELLELESETLLQDANSFFSLIHPDDLSSFQDSVAIAVKNSALWHWEGRFITPSGQLKWIQGRSRPQKIEYGNAWDGLLLDISDRKQAEEALRQSEERLRVALKNSPITVFNQDQELRYTWLYNPTLDYHATTVIGKQDQDFLSKSDAAVLTQIKRHVLETGIGAREEVKVVMQGQVFYYDLTVEPLLDMNGETIGITCASFNITDRKQMELELRRSETALSALVASSPIGIALFDCDLRYIHVNEALAALNGVPLSDHLGRTLSEVLPEWSSMLVPILQQVMETQQPLLNQELVGVTYPADLVRHGLINYFPVCSLTGEVLGVGVTSVDISDLRRIEESLRQSEERYRAIYDQVLVGISQTDLTGKIISTNERFCEIVGRSVEELLTLRMQDITHPDDLPHNLVLFERMLKEGTSFEVEKRYLRPDGSLVWVRNYVSLICNQDGQPQFGVAVTEDITQQKQAEANLTEQRQLLATILEHTADAIVVCDATGTLTFVNPEAKRLAQEDAYDSTVNLNLLNWGTAYDANGNYIPLEDYAISKALRGETSNAFESRMIRADGSYYDILISAAPLLNNGQIVGAVANFTDISDRKRIEEEREQVQQELQQTLQTLRTLIQASPLPIIVIEPDLTVNLWNAAAEQVFGWSEAEVLGQPIPIVPEEKQEECNQLRDAVINGEVFFGVETYRRQRDGSHVILSVSAAPLYDDHDRVNAILLILQDITERQRAEQALRESEEWARLAIQVGRLGGWRLHLDTNFVEMDERMREIWGEPADAVMIPLPQVIDRIHPDDQERVVNAVSAAITPQSSGMYEIEYRIVWDDGTERWVSAKGQAQFEGEGESRQTVDFFGTLQDITDRKRAESALRESEERLRLALMAANQGLYDLNVQTGDAIVSPAYAQMLGYDPDEFQETNANWRDRLHPNDVSVVYQAYEDYIAGRLDTYRVEFRQRTKLGDWKWILSVGKIVSYDAEGQPLRMLGTHTDINDRKRAETEREQLLVREQAAREQAETANRIKDEFLAVLSHELRSPLNPILGWSRLLQTQKFNEQTVQQALSTIERNAKLQTQLIEDLLDVSRILRGKLILNTTVVSLTHVVESALETVRLAAEAKGIHIERAFNLNIDQVMGDAARLQQVMWNLLSNAVKFTSSGGRVEVRLEQNETHALIQVKDTGKGINPDFLPYVFDYFRQEDGTTTRKFGGLGLGLAIVRHLTELHGGSVWADSLGEGAGATFTVQLPLILSLVDADEREEYLTVSNLAGFKILAVDDDNDIRTLIEFILRQAGADVRVVASAAEVLQQLETFSPDILVSDIGMPDFDGYMLMRQVRSLPSKHRKIPAIALTAYAGEIDQQQAIATGFQMHLTKPIEPEKLINAIATLLKDLKDPET